MSDLLRLREWLSLNDALRHLANMGLRAPKLDLFNAYTEAGFPLQLETNFDGYSTTPAEFGGKWPGEVDAEWSSNTQQFVPKRGAMYRLTRPNLMVHEGSQCGFTSNAVVFLEDPLSFDENKPDPMPIYALRLDDRQQIFSVVTWGEILAEPPTFSLKLHRAHLDKLVQRIDEVDAPEQNPASDDARDPAAASAPPPYLSPTHESYPPELATAVMLWEALYLRGEKSQHHGHTHAAKLWLEKNRDSLPTAHLTNHGSGEWFNRLTTITSPEAKKQKR